ncbi:MAG TPA: hypothetical protein VEY06_06330, partial [Flavisolibacter sp.]|nr:hypothetical protein [Flavisolibacter sp.]
MGASFKIKLNVQKITWYCFFADSVNRCVPVFTRRRFRTQYWGLKQFQTDERVTGVKIKTTLHS